MILTRYLSLVLLSFILGCGGVSIGTGGGTTSPNDARPTGSPLAQAQFTSQNGKTATGSAAIYFSGTGTYTVRLEGISVPVETGLLVQVYATPGGKIGNFTLRASTGNQNYTLSNSVNGLTFNSVYIYSNVNNLNYGAALFQ